jgi:hypothetical protein
MRRILSVAVILSVLWFVPLAAQDDGPNVYLVRYITVLDAKYLTYFQEALIPVWDEFVRSGKLVSYDIAVQVSGSGDVTHIAVEEYADWDAADGLLGAYEEASQAVHGRSWAEVTEGYYPLDEIRKIRTDIYWSIKP